MRSSLLTHSRADSCPQKVLVTFTGPFLVRAWCTLVYMVRACLYQSQGRWGRARPWGQPGLCCPSSSSSSSSSCFSSSSYQCSTAGREAPVGRQGGGGEELAACSAFSSQREPTARSSVDTGDTKGETEGKFWWNGGGGNFQRVGFCVTSRAQLYSVKRRRRRQLKSRRRRSCGGKWRRRRRR